MTSNFRRWAALVIVCFGQLMIMVDTTIVNVALPYMQRDLGFSPANLTWWVNAYLIAYGSFLLVAGRLGDLIGRRKVFLAGVFLFTVASIGSGFAQGADHLIVGRFLQGLGGSLSAGVIIAIIVTEFQKPVERAQAMSVFTLVIAGGGSLGLLAGGFLTQWVSWHWIFFINVPIGILTLVLGVWLIDENEGLGLSHGVDIPGAVLITAALMLGVYGIVTAADYGWTSAHTLGFGGASIALTAAFVLLESRLRNPLVPLRVFAIRSLTGATAARALLFSGLFTNFFVGALHLGRAGQRRLPAGIRPGRDLRHGLPDGRARRAAGSRHPGRRARARASRGVRARGGLGTGGNLRGDGPRQPPALGGVGGDQHRRRRRAPPQCSRRGPAGVGRGQELDRGRGRGSAGCRRSGGQRPPLPVLRLDAGRRDDRLRAQRLHRGLQDQDPQGSFLPQLWSLRLAKDDGYDAAERVAGRDLVRRRPVDGPGQSRQPPQACCPA